MSNDTGVLLWRTGTLRVCEPRIDGGLHGPTLTVDVEIDGLRYIIRVESRDGGAYPHGIDVPVKFANLAGEPKIRMGVPLVLWVGSRRFGELVATENPGVI